MAADNDRTESEPLVLTVPQVASLLQKKERTIREMSYQKKIPHFKIGRSLRYKRSEILKWLGQVCRVPGTPNPNNEIE